MAKRKHKKPIAVSIKVEDLTGPGHYNRTRWLATGKLTIDHRVRSEVTVHGADEDVAVHRALLALAAALAP